MSFIGSLLLQHGYWFLFVYSLLVAIGLPVPADPLFVVMGAMVGNHQYAFFPSLLIALAALLIGDHLWYQLGRLRGQWVLGFLCKLSFEPDTCVRKTEAAFAKRGAAALLFAKFVPGIGLLSVSLAGISRIRYWRFLVADAAGCALWAGSYLRHPAEVQRSGLKIAGALVLRPDELSAGSQQIPAGHEIILYCT